MSSVLTRRGMIAASLCAMAHPALALPRPYALVMRQSSIVFEFILNGIAQRGTVPVGTADIRVDPQRLRASTADVTADVSQARTGVIFMTQALLGKDVLDADSHPTVRFQSTNIRLGEKGRISEGAEIDGMLTLRGQTHPITLGAMITRPAGTVPDALDRLSVHLTGQISRSRFGASGYPGLVDDRVALDIRAELQAIG